MLFFENIEDLVSYMFENTDNDDNRISVVVNKDIAVDALKELLNYENVELSICDIDSDIAYEREYIVSLFDDVDSDKWYVSVEKAYLIEKGKYLSIGGYVLFHEDVNSMVMFDMQHNEFMPLGKHDWFIVGEEEDSNIDNKDEAKDTDLDAETDDEDSGYFATVKVSLDTDEADRLICDIEKDMRRKLSDMFDMLYRPYLYKYRPLPIRVLL